MARRRRPTIARNAWPARIARDGTLHVATSSSAWAFELAAARADDARKLRDAVGEDAPVELRFAVGPLPEPAARRRRAASRTASRVRPEQREGPPRWPRGSTTTSSANGSLERPRRASQGRGRPPVLIHFTQPAKRNLQGFFVMAEATYTAKDITVLEGLEPVRSAPGHVHRLDRHAGLHHLVYEVVDNAVDEALAGRQRRDRGHLHPDNSVTVADQGRGIPVDVVKDTRACRR